MPAARRHIDPSTGDYLLEGGRPRGDDTSVSAVWLRFTTKRGSVPTLQDFGSRFHEIRKVNDQTARQMESFATQAVQDLIDREEIRDVTPRAEVAGGRIMLTLGFRDRKGTRQHVRYTHRTG